MESSGGSTSSGGDVDSTQITKLSNRIENLEARMSMLGQLADYNIKLLTIEQYEALETKNPNTLYFIADEPTDED